MARDVQAGLDFSAGRPRELFDGLAMGENALRLLGEYRNLLTEMREIVARETKVLSESLRWERTARFGITRFTGRYECPEEKIHPMG